MAALDGGETEAKEGIRFQVIKQQRFDRTRPPDGSPMFSPAQQHIEAAPRPLPGVRGGPCPLQRPRDPPSEHSGHEVL